MPTLADEMLAAARRLSGEVERLRFAPPVTHVYNPLEYAWAAHRMYIEKYGASRKRVVLLGMNPGPFGMAQTGVPFGEVARVRDFLGIGGPTASIGKPAHEHPERPISGFACTRSEVSGARVWGLVEAHWGTAAAFFAEHYVANYCPLLFMEASGKNRTPDKLASGERAALSAACDRHLRRVVELLAPEWVIGVGGYAEQQARAALGDTVKIGRILHPSPASPAANLGWADAAAAELRAQGIVVPVPKDSSPAGPRSASAVPRDRSPAGPRSAAADPKDRSPAGPRGRRGSADDPKDRSPAGPRSAAADPKDRSPAGSRGRRGSAADPKDRSPVGPAEPEAGDVAATPAVRPRARAPRQLRAGG